MIDHLAQFYYPAMLFFAGLVLTLALSPLSIRLSVRVNAIDLPDERKVHSMAVSRLGGTAMVAGLAAPLLLLEKPDPLLAAFLFGAAIVTLTGFLDDVYRIPPTAKFLGEIAAAGIFVYMGGVSLIGFGDLFGAGDINAGILAPLLTVFCMAGVMNAFNLSDGLDGLAGGIAAIACVFLAVFAYLSQDWLSVSILVALMGAILGFLRYNSYPANLFMGDTGSLLLGYSLSAVAVMLVRDNYAGIRLAPVTVAAVLALPILDTLLVMAHRIRHGGNPFLPDRAHLHHRLLRLGLPHSAVVTILYISAAAFGFQAWTLRMHSEWVQFAAVVALGGAIYGLVFLAQQSGLQWTELARRKPSPHAGRLHAFMTKAMGKSVPAAGWAIAAGLFLPTLVLRPVPQAISVTALAVGGFVAVLFPWKTRLGRSSVCYGLMYAGSGCLLGIFHFIPGAPQWLPSYFVALSAVVLVWVLLKMKYRGHGEIVFLSAFEILLMGGFWFIPIVLIPAMGLDAQIRKLMFTVCLEASVFLLAMKILVRRQPRRNRVLVGSFIVALAVIGLKGFVLADAKASFNAAFATHGAVSSYAYTTTAPRTPVP